MTSFAKRRDALMVSCEEPASGAGLDLSAGIIATMSYRRSEKVSGPDKAAEGGRREPEKLEEGKMGGWLTPRETMAPPPI
jgi:hypothetical protein